MTDSKQLHDWVAGILNSNMLYLEVPLLWRMMDAWTRQDLASIGHWNEYLLASRETRELRNEESNRARAFYQVLTTLEQRAQAHREQLIRSQHACFSFACVHWGIDQQQAAYGLLWSWLENLVLSAVKLIPLGQSAGQQVLFELSDQISFVIERAQQIEDDDLGASSMALAIASSQHENQYTRLFRS